MTTALARSEPTSLSRNRFSGGQVFLLSAGILLLASAAVHGVVFLLSGTGWDGPLSWRKPILFGFSFGITLATIALLASFLRLRPLLDWLLLGGLGLLGMGETALITMQTWRGVASHFNFSTAFDSGVFVAMGVEVAGIALALLVITALFFTRAADGPRAMLLAIRVSMLLLLVGQVLGGLIVAVGVPAAASGDDAVFGPQGVVFGDGGILKSPHGIAMHAIQVLPLLAWLGALAGWGGRRQFRMSLASALGYTLVLGVSVVQALAGKPPLALNLASLAMAALGTLLVGAPYALALWSLALRRGPWTERDGASEAGQPQGAAGRDQR